MGIFPARYSDGPCKRSLRLVLGKHIALLLKKRGAPLPRPLPRRLCLPHFVLLPSMRCIQWPRKRRWCEGMITTGSSDCSAMSGARMARHSRPMCRAPSCTKSCFPWTTGFSLPFVTAPPGSSIVRANMSCAPVSPPNISLCPRHSNCPIENKLILPYSEPICSGNPPRWASRARATPWSRAMKS